jgi:rSAM/selenodomain-associated transferase 1
LTVTEEVVAVFARAPELGKVKSRLCPPLTADEALALHRALVADTLIHVGRVERPNLSRMLLLSQPLRHPDDLEIPKEWTVSIQPSGDLGERMASLFYTSFRRNIARLVLLGSDSPTLPVEVIYEAFDSLETSDVVLGPAEDGGYYLIGARRFVPEIFRNIPWGSGEVLNQTTAVLRELGLGFELLIPWYDIDRGEDLVKLHSEIAYLKRTAPELVPKRVDAVLPDVESEYTLDDR